DMPRLSMRSPTLAQTTMDKTMARVFKRSRCSEAIVRSVVAGGGRGLRNGNHRLVDIAALAGPLPAFRAQLQERSGFVIKALAFVRVPQGFAHNAPNDARTEVVFVVKAVDCPHHLGLGEMRVFDVRKLVAASVGKSLDLEETFFGHGVVQLSA